MFDGIALRYDALNNWLSLGMDMWWRKTALRKLKEYQIDNLIDIAKGTSDFAILANDILKPKQITAIDISDGMMDVGRVKVREANLVNKIYFQYQDCASMSFENETFDA